MVKLARIIGNIFLSIRENNPKILPQHVRNTRVAAHSLVLVVLASKRSSTAVFSGSISTWNHVKTKTITFRMLKDRLLAVVRRRIDNGEYTERGFARLLGISQSQVHNVLKGARTLHADLADLMITKLGLTAQQLLDGAELEVGVKLHREGQSWHGTEDGPAFRDIPERDRLHSLRKPLAADSARVVTRAR